MSNRIVSAPGTLLEAMIASRKLQSALQKPSFVSAVFVTTKGEAGGLFTTRCFESLGMPLVNIVTRAGPGGKLLTGIEIKVVSDQPPTGSTGKKTNWLLSMLRNWTTG